MRERYEIDSAILHKVRQGFSKIGAAGVRAAESGKRFNKILKVQMAEYTYISKKGQLPGSKRTKRLRKKREKIVMEFFRKYIGEKAGGTEAC